MNLHSQQRQPRYSPEIINKNQLLSELENNSEVAKRRTKYDFRRLSDKDVQLKMTESFINSLQKRKSIETKYRQNHSAPKIQGKEVLEKLQSLNPFIKNQKILQFKRQELENFESCIKCNYYIPFLLEIINCNASSIDNDPLLKRFKQHHKLLQKGLMFCKLIPQNQLQLQIKQLPEIYFGPQKQKQKTIIFDLDETLVHTSRNCKFETEQILTASVPSLGRFTIGLNVRPHLLTVLTELSLHFELALFTASDRGYANFILSQIPQLDQLIPENRRIYRNNCVYFHQYGHFAIKPLEIIKDRELSNMVIVDNSIQSFACNLSNGIVCLPFINQQDDQELIKLSEFCLAEILNANDVRGILEKTLQLTEAVELGDWSKQSSERKLSFLSKQSAE